MFLGFQGYSQSDILEIDTLTFAASKVMPYNKAFTVKVPIEGEEVSQVDIIKKYKYFDLSGTIGHYISKNNGRYYPPRIPSNYYYTRKIADKNYLFLSIADTFLLEPAASYYIIIRQKKLGGAVLGFFDNYYQSLIGTTVGARDSSLTDARESLKAFEANMAKIFGSLVYGYTTLREFDANRASFLTSFNSNVLNDYRYFTTVDSAYNSSLITNIPLMMASIPNFDSLTYKQLLVDSTINKDALTFLMGKDFVLNNLASDINSLTLQSRLLSLLNGSISLDCIFCPPVNASSTLQNDYSKRVTNIDASINSLNNLKRSLFLLQPKSGPRSNISTSINSILGWIAFLQTSKTGIKGLVTKRKIIESKIVDSLYAGYSFENASMASGNSYLNFETRNKVLLTPDFGIVTSSISKNGKSLEYGIVPYLGFHINLMAVDKDLHFNSYKKHWKQYLSVMVGWSLVNMQQDSSYGNFFEKSSLLTGVGYRLSNVIRITAGSQWLFKLGTDINKNPTRKLAAMPFIGISFDLNVKQYLNGFVDLLSGIGKTQAPKPPTTINGQ